jgi:hypothetical protein
MRFVNTRPYADPEVAARKIVEIANSIEAVQDGRIQCREDQRAVPLPAQGLASRVRRGHETCD